METWSCVSKSLLSSTKSTEVLGSLGNDVSTEFHDNTSSGLSTDGDVEVALGVRPVILGCKRERKSKLGELIYAIRARMWIRQWNESSHASLKQRDFELEIVFGVVTHIMTLSTCQNHQLIDSTSTNTDREPPRPRIQLKIQPNRYTSREIHWNFLE